jgi:hypothetical protein
VVTGLAGVGPELPEPAEVPLLEVVPLAEAVPLAEGVPLGELALAVCALRAEFEASAGSWPDTSWTKIPIHTATNTAVATAMNRFRSLAIRARRAASFDVWFWLSWEVTLRKHRPRSQEKGGRDGRYL